MRGGNCERRGTMEVEVIYTPTQNYHRTLGAGWWLESSGSSASPSIVELCPGAVVMLVVDGVQRRSKLAMIF